MKKLEKELPYLRSSGITSSSSSGAGSDDGDLCLQNLQSTSPIKGIMPLYEHEPLYEKALYPGIRTIISESEVSSSDISESDILF